MIYVCESYPGYRKHLREGGEPFFSGFKTAVKCLCGLELGPGRQQHGWDTRIPATAYDAVMADPHDRGCKGCYEITIEMSTCTKGVRAIAGLPEEE